VVLTVNLTAKIDDFFKFRLVRLSFSQNFSDYHTDITVRTSEDFFGGQIMNLGALALEAYEFDGPCFMGFSFCFFPGFLLFNVHGHLPFSAGKCEVLIVKTAAVRLRGTLQSSR